ncbi:MAG: glycoside hydrolase family 15 protein [Acidobacteriota bacterium]|nr:glycoside hydrolase family 15 protein [Acidobacteriota bacterium]
MVRAIEDYAMIGNCQTAALVGRDGSIDWMCLPRFDSDACFARLLGTPENGRWLIGPTTRARTKRSYRPDTLILETEFVTATGRALLTDFMPANTAKPKIVRIVRGLSGKVHMRTELTIRFDYGRTVPWVTKRQDAMVAVAGPHLLAIRTPVPLEGKDLHTVGEFTVRKGKAIAFVMEYGSSSEPIPPGVDWRKALRTTAGFWCDWITKLSYDGPWAPALKRSLLTVKALTYAPTGGIVAAPTTSLPERIGGPLNWDYRYCWVRDATFTLLALIHAGYHGEAHRWREWLKRAVAGSFDQLQIVYGVAGERKLLEWDAEWLAGYGRSAPVRIGNAASEQLQLDVYGELADCLHQARGTRIGNHDREGFNLQTELLNHLEKIWREPDNGIWEIRGKKQQYTHSKMMAWVAYDRTIQTAEAFGMAGPVEEWKRVREQIHADVCRRGFNEKIGAFVQAYGSKRLDASLLMMPLVGFLPAADPRVQGTVRAIEKHLMRKGFVMRYEVPDVKGGVGEGAFLPCSFWLADNYELMGRHEDAKRLLERLLALRNDVGLFSEEYDFEEGRQLGNFPQAFTHLSLINTVLNLFVREGGPAHRRSARHPQGGANLHRRRTRRYPLY